MPREESDGLSLHFSEDEFIRGLAIRGFDRAFFFDLQALHLVETGAAEDSQGVFHITFSLGLGV
jgi:hypothetical protein